ncbi:hypothetical protein [Streptosporangium sp. NPDC049376]|uniref:hypothetical protein n=1 Tax=Streptosporangium sp. NPDC049376 TaxID=3366192 RepID=UPI0037B7148B
MAKGFVEIRAVSHLAERALADGETDTALRHLEHMRVIADVCHNLPGDFLPKRREVRERKAVKSLRFHFWELDPGDRVPSGSRGTWKARGSTTFAFSAIGSNGGMLGIRAPTGPQERPSRRLCKP